MSNIEKNCPEHKGITLSWVQFAIAIASFIISMVTPLLVFVNHTDVRIAVLEEQVTRHEELIKENQTITNANTNAIERITTILTRLEKQ